MIPIPPALLTRFEECLFVNNIILDKYHIHYKKWLRFYLDYCDKYLIESTRRESLGTFMQKLRDKNKQKCNDSRHCMQYLYITSPWTSSPFFLLISLFNGSLIFALMHARSKARRYVRTGLSLSKFDSEVKIRSSEPAASRIERRGSRQSSAPVRGEEQFLSSGAAHPHARLEQTRLHRSVMASAGLIPVPMRRALKGTVWILASLAFLQRGPS